MNRSFAVTYEQFIQKFNIKLNEQQSCAVQETEGAVLLLAVPGSGKTTVLVTRLGYMLYCKGIDPRSILTMTYTVAATNDMRQRFCRFFGDEYSSQLEFRTINGVCARIIRTYEQLSGSKAFELITNEKELSALIAAIYRETENGFPTESDIKNVRTLITYAKNMMLSDNEIKSLDKQCSGFPEMYRKYCEALRVRKVMDYDDQMVYALRILRRYPQILEKVHSRYQYICVDEAQDTSKIQHEIISLLAQKRGNIFMVGDEDQSIYGFRAAYPQALMSFKEDYENAKILLMEENFRSGAKIIGAADRFISKNANRHQKTMRAVRNEADMIKKIPLISKHEQYSYLLDMARKCDIDTAVLYRDNESALPLIDLFERNGILYRLRAADMTFFTHRVVQDVRNIIAFAYDPYNADAFLQIYYKISTYLSKAAAVAACETAVQRKMSVWEALALAEGLSPATAKSCKNIKAQFELLPKDRGDKAISRIFNSMGFGDYLDRMGMKTDKLSILSAIGTNEVSPSGLLRRLDELERLVQLHENPENAFITLSTIHSSKGLEYDTVYLIDVYDGMFPETVVGNSSHFDKDTVRLYQEERRLFYVGVTRAKNKLCLFTYADEDSSFTDEFLAPRTRTVEIKASCVVGDKMVHKVFGEGTVLSVNGDIVKIDFKSGEVKAFSLNALYSQNLLI